MMNSSRAFRALCILAAMFPATIAFAGGPYDFEVSHPGGPIPDEGIGVFSVVVSPKVNIATLEVLVEDLTHEFPEDLDLYLISPFGTYIELMTDRGGGTAIAEPVDLVFLDSAAGIPGTPIGSGEYAPEGYFNATDGGLGTFSGGSSGVGAWILLAIDDAAADTGSIGGFTLRGTVPEPGVLTLVAAGLLACLRRRS